MTNKKIYTYNERELCYEEIDTTPMIRKKYFFPKIIAAVSILIVASVFALQPESPIFSLLPVSYPKEIHPLTIENVAKKIADEQLKFGDITLAQILIESGNLKSQLAVKNNNITAMKVPGHRPSKMNKEKSKEWSYYDSWEDCVEDLRLWQVHVSSKYQGDRLTYLTFLEAYYDMGDGAYATSIMNRINDPVIAKIIKKYKLDEF